MKIKLDAGAFSPTRAHETDAGLDLYAKSGAVVTAYDHKTIGTGVHIQLPKNTAGLIVSKSGIYAKHGVTSTGLIDEGYTGEVMVTITNNSDKEYSIRAGQKISQLVIIPVIYEGIDVVESINGGDRGDKGFGSTGI